MPSQDEARLTKRGEGQETSKARVKPKPLILGFESNSRPLATRLLNIAYAQHMICTVVLEKKTVYFRGSALSSPFRVRVRFVCS